MRPPSIQLTIYFLLGLLLIAHSESISKGFLSFSLNFSKFFPLKVKKGAPSIVLSRWTAHLLQSWSPHYKTPWSSTLRTWPAVVTIGSTLTGDWNISTRWFWTWAQPSPPTTSMARSRCCKKLRPWCNSLKSPYHPIQVNNSSLKSYLSFFFLAVFTEPLSLIQMKPNNFAHSFGTLKMIAENSGVSRNNFLSFESKLESFFSQDYGF